VIFERGGRKLVYENVKRRADEKNLSIRDLEKEAGLQNGTIGKWRVSSPTVKSLQAVARVLGCTVDDLLEE